MIHKISENKYNSLIKNRSGIVDYYCEKIDDKNIIISYRGTYEIIDDGEKTLDGHAIRANLIFKKCKIIKDKEDTIVIILYTKTFYDHKSSNLKIYMGSLSNITYIANKGNIKKPIDKEYVINILDNEKMYTSHIIIYKNEYKEHDVIIKKKSLMGDIYKKMFMGELKDAKNVFLSHYIII